MHYNIVNIFKRPAKFLVSTKVMAFGPAGQCRSLPTEIFNSVLLSN